MTGATPREEAISTVVTPFQVRRAVENEDTTYIVGVSVCHCASFKRKKRVARKGNKTRRSRQRSGRKSEHLGQQGGEQVVEQENTQGCLRRY